MPINKKIVIGTAVVLALGASSCKKFLNVNNNPNQSPTATVETLLPAAELYVGTSMGVDMQIIGSIWAQYWTQTPVASQYVTFDQYAPGQDGFSNAWQNLYTAGENLYQLAKLADTQHKKNYTAISLLLRAYTFQVITDAWGDAPFKQALQGQYADGHLVNPKYDSQRVVYNGIIAYIDTAMSIIKQEYPITPAGDDLIYGGDMSKWEKFANTLKLRVLLRLSEVDPAGTQAAIDSFYATSPVFIGEGDDAAIASYGSSTANKNPLNAEMTSTTLNSIQNLAGSTTVIDSMNSNGDPRAYLFFTYLSNGTVVGIPQGKYDAHMLPSEYNIPSSVTGGNASDANSSKAPVILLSSWESFFLQAEVVARGYQAQSSGMDDAALFSAGIAANFDYPLYATTLSDIWGATALSDYLASGGYWTVYPTSGTVTDKVKFIITQKWFAMCGNEGFEAWTEWRRTGYPDFFVIPPHSFLGSNRPQRFLYPTSESTTNLNFPSSGVVPLTTNVWWDKL